MDLRILAAIALVFATMSTSLCLEGDDESVKPHLEGPWSDMIGLKQELNSLSSLPVKYVDTTADAEGITDPSSTLYVLPGLDSPLKGNEVLALKKYIEAGGHLILADDSNMTEDLVQIFGIQLWAKPYRPGWRYTSDWVYNLSFLKCTGEVGGVNYTLLVHSPMGMNLTGEGKIVLSLPHYATIELNGDGQESMGDAFFAVAPVAVEVNVDGGGSMLFVSSSGLFTDNVFDRYDNRAFLRAYFASILPGGGRIYFDDTKQSRGISPHNVILKEE